MATTQASRVRKALADLVKAIDHAYEVEDTDVLKASAYAQAVLDLTEDN